MVVEGVAEATVELPAAVVEAVETMEPAALVKPDELDGTGVGGFVLATMVAGLGALFESTCPLPATLFGLLKYTFSKLPAPQNSFLFPVHNMLQLLSDAVVAVLEMLEPQ